MHERYLTMSFKPPAGVTGWDLPHLKIRAKASRIIQDGCSGFKMANGELHLRGGPGQPGGPGDGMHLVRQGSWGFSVFGVVVGSWRTGAIIGSGFPVIGCSQLLWGSWQQGAVGWCEGPRVREWSVGLRDPGVRAQPVRPGVLRGLAVVSKWWHPRVIKPAGTVTVNF